MFDKQDLSYKEFVLPKAASLTFLTFFLSGLTRSASVLGPSSAATCASSSRLISEPSAHFRRAFTAASSRLVFAWYLRTRHSRPALLFHDIQKSYDVEKAQRQQSAPCKRGTAHPACSAPS